MQQKESFLCGIRLFSTFIVNRRQRIVDPRDPDRIRTKKDRHGYDADYEMFSNLSVDTIQRMDRDDITGAVSHHDKSKRHEKKQK
jgi:hypothetical protein